MDAEWGMWSVPHVVSALLPPQGEDSSPPSFAPVWGPSHGGQSSMNFSSVSPSHGLQFLRNCSSLGLSQGVQSLRNRLPVSVPVVSPVLPANLLHLGLLSPGGPARSQLQPWLPAVESQPLSSIQLLYLAWDPP